MEQIDIPGTDESVNPTDPVGSAKTLTLLTIGAGAGLTALAAGEDIKDYVYARITSAAGVESQQTSNQLVDFS